MRRSRWIAVRVWHLRRLPKILPVIIVRVMVRVIAHGRAMVELAVAVGKIPVIHRTVRRRPVKAFAAPALSPGVRQRADVNRPQRAMGGASDVLHGNATVHHRPAMDVEIIDLPRLMENLRHTLSRSAVIARTAVAEMFRRNERETAGIQPEIKINPDANTTIKKSEAGTKHRQRRQRRPAAIIIVGTPRHP